MPLQRGLHASCEAPKSCVERGDVMAGDTLLRPIRRRRAVRTTQRIVDVRQEDQLASFDSRIQGSDIDALDPSQGRQTGRDRLTAGVEQPNPQRREHARATVVGAAPAERDEKTVHAGVEQCADQLAHAPRRARGRRQRHRDPIGDPDDLGDFDNRGVPIGAAQDSVGGLDGVPPAPLTTRP